MITTIHARRDVHCPFSATIEMIERLHRSGPEHTVGPFKRLRTRVHCDFKAVRDYTDQTRIHEALVLQWKSRSPLLLLPVMRGMITVRPNGRFTELRMEGSYTPPLGSFGAIFDRLIGRGLAQRTIERFLDDLQGFVEREWTSERQAQGADDTIGTKP